VIRKVLFWLHLATGVTAGVVIFIMSFTGTALALQPQILAWIERGERVIHVPAGAVRLSPAVLLERVRAQRPGATVTALTIEREPSLAATVTFVPASTVFVNPYTGDITGVVQQTGARRFFRTMTDWHRWLAREGDERVAARWVTGIANAAFLGLAVTGLVLWWPRVWTAASVRAVTFFRRGVSGRARDFNWHNVIGFWCAPVLVVLTFSGMAISFPKMYDVIYAVTGMTRPPAAAPAPSNPVPQPVHGINQMWATAEQQLPSWRSIAMRVPQAAGQPVTFTINDLETTNAMARSTLTMNATTGAVIKWDPYNNQPAGQRLRTWLRFGHTGEVWGLTGQLIAGLASAGGCVLVYTSFALAWRRFRSWRRRQIAAPALVQVRHRNKQHAEDNETNDAIDAA
jgi:uncharacterized iron-regulated membrane protein